MGDLEDIVPAYAGRTEYPLGSCNAYIRIKDDQMFAAHTTFNMYNLMLRIFKKHEFHLNNPDAVNSVI